MKHLNVWLLMAAVVLFAASAVAQHGPTGTMGPGSHALSQSSRTLGTSQHQPASLNNPKLAQQIQTLTNSPNEPASQICAPFKNLGQCVAAAHVSKNLNIGFNCLEAAMLGQKSPTGCTTNSANTALYTKPMSLGSAIKALKPGTNAGAEAKKARKQASQDINSSNS
jgi:hypothetical protein